MVVVILKAKNKSYKFKLYLISYKSYHLYLLEGIFYLLSLIFQINLRNQLTEEQLVLIRIGPCPFLHSQQSPLLNNIDMTRHLQ